MKAALTLAALAVFAAVPANAADIRARTRPTNPGGTAVSSAQANELTLTVTPAAERAIQVWVRTAAASDATGKLLRAELNARDGEPVQVGQRARAFTLSSKSSMYQARITRATRDAGRVAVEATLASGGRPDASDYILEVVVDRGRFLSVPNAAIIEEGDTHIVYVQQHPGHYIPTAIHTGIQGELYTQVLHGLEPDDEVVTFGSFFVDAEYKLKTGGGAEGAMAHEHHH